MKGFPLYLLPLAFGRVFPMDMSKYRGMFFAETQEHLRSMAQLVVSLEKIRRIGRGSIPCSGRRIPSREWRLRWDTNRWRNWPIIWKT
jgi:hypothetical protein